MGTRLRGRAVACAAIDGLLHEARSGRSGVLVVRGEAGMGKTSLLEYAAGNSRGWRVLSAAGVQSEMELPFAGLHLLCAPLLSGAERLPEPQRDALGTAFGMHAGLPPDRFLMGLAVLGLLSDAGAERPLLCLVDDAQWLDRSSAQVLAFVARRLRMDSVALLLAERDEEQVGELTGLPELRLAGLSEVDARDLLASTIAGPLDERVRERIIAETRGNPLALLELPRGVTAAGLAGGFDVTGSAPLPSRIEASFRRRVAEMPAETQQWLLLAAAEPIGDPSLLGRAGERLGISAQAAVPAQMDGLVRLDVRVTFRHPLLRSAIYGAASLIERQIVHRALADATDVSLDPDRRAWHRAQASPGPDEDIAAELVHSAGRAQTRGGLAAAAAFLQQAARLTPGAADRARRLLAAARATHQAGAPETARALVIRAQAGPLEEADRAQVELLHAEMTFASPRGGRAPALLLAAARRLEPFDPALARDTYLKALSAALFVGRFAGDVDAVAVAGATESAPAPCASTSRPSDLLLAGLSSVIRNGYVVGAPHLKDAVRAFRTGDLAADEALRWLWLATHAAHDVWDDESWQVLCNRHIELARQAGELAVLPLALSARVGLHLFAGELVAAESLVDELAVVAQATGNQLPPYAAIAVAAWRGDESKASPAIDAAAAEVVSRGDGMGLTLIRHATAVLYNALGHYQKALTAAEDGTAYPYELAFYHWSLAELVEAAVRCGRPARAAEALQQLVRSTQPSGTDWALGTQTRSHALLSSGAIAEDLYRQAIDHFSRTSMTTESARAHLVFGEWLRRENRRLDARTELRTAHEMFTAIGAHAFADRAGRELLGTGDVVRKRSAGADTDLTSQEAQIARYVRDGLSNSEIGARLFLSPRTVEWHLTTVFAKLGITSRRELAAARGYLGAGPSRTE